MKENIKGMLHYIRQAFGVSLVLMLVCGLLFPLLLSGISAILFPHQAEGSLIEINGKAVAAENVGQEFTEDYYLWSRPSAYHYNVYIENADGTQTYQDGSEFSGIGSGSNNYAPSNPELVERVEADMALFLERMEQEFGSHLAEKIREKNFLRVAESCLLYTSPSPRD